MTRGAASPSHFHAVTYNVLCSALTLTSSFLCCSRKMKVLLVIAALMVAQTTAHLCLLFPHQRGTAQGLDMAGRDMSRI